MDSHAQIIVDFMAEHGITQVEMAQRLQVTPATLSRWLSGSHGISKKHSITECFEFSGLTRRAWCETLGISDALWSQYRTGRVKVPDKLQKEAVNLALLGAAVRIHAAKITRKKDI